MCPPFWLFFSLFLLLFGQSCSSVENQKASASLPSSESISKVSENDVTTTDLLQAITSEGVSVLQELDIPAPVTAGLQLNESGTLRIEKSCAKKGNEVQIVVQKDVTDVREWFSRTIKDTYKDEVIRLWAFPSQLEAACDDNRVGLNPEDNLDGLKLTSTLNSTRTIERLRQETELLSTSTITRKREFSSTWGETQLTDESIQNTTVTNISTGTLQRSFVYVPDPTFSFTVQGDLSSTSPIVVQTTRNRSTQKISDYTIKSGIYQFTNSAGGSVQTTFSDLKVTFNETEATCQFESGSIEIQFIADEETTDTFSVTPSDGKLITTVGEKEIELLHCRKNDFRL